MKINNHVEQIFAHAVALNQSGGLRNTIYGIGDEVFILNYDHTVLLRFKLRASEVKFDQPISFHANDYDSNVFEEKNGRIIFHSENQAFTRKKISGTSDTTPEEVKNLFERYAEDEEREGQTVTVSKDLMEMLESNLSHVEFSGEAGGNLKIVQRNIYSGGIIEVEKKGEGMFAESLENDFGPVAIKTDDLNALFAFDEKSYRFSFPHGENQDFIRIDSVDKRKRDIVGIVACSLYDEVINIRESKPQKEEAQNGRKKQKVRRRK